MLYLSYGLGVSEWLDPDQQVRIGRSMEDFRGSPGVEVESRRRGADLLASVGVVGHDVLELIAVQHEDEVGT